MMNRASHNIASALLAAVFVLAATSTPARAQYDTKWLSVGSLAHHYSDAITLPVPGGFNGMAREHWYPNRRTFHGGAMWVGARNVRGDDGTMYPVRIATMGNRFSGEGEWFPTEEFDMISKRSPTEVWVDGIQSFRYLIDNDVVDPDLAADRMIRSVANSIVGVTVEQKVLQFSNEFHDDYHIVEYVLTNTGNIDGDAEIENPDATLEDVYFFMGHKYVPLTQEGMGISRRHGFNPSGWGRDQMNDAVGDGHEDYEEDFTAQYAWGGTVPEFGPWDGLGMPSIDGIGFNTQDNDSLGRLTAAEFVGRIYLHADSDPRLLDGDSNPPRPVPNPSSQSANYPGQPSSMFYYGGDDPHFFCSPCAWDQEHMNSAWEAFMVRGRVYPHHADHIAPGDGPWSDDRMAKQSIPPSDPPEGRDTAGWNFGETWGPWTLAPGESVRIVVADAIGGLSRQAAMEIGRRYKEAYLAGDDERPIGYDANGDGTIDPVTESKSKNLWVMSARDSLFKTFRRARAAMEAGYDIPEAPAPPSRFEVASGPDRITLTWETYAGEPDPSEWEIYRQQGNLLWQEWEKLGSVPGSARMFEDTFEDTQAARGIGYFYYIQAVGPVNTEPTAMTPTGVPLRSSRAFTQTYDPATLTRPPGPEIDAARVVPNPFVLDSDENIRWPDQQDKIAFLEIPGQCRIDIYTEIGEKIKTIHHVNGSGDEYWDLTTESRQVVVSGVYFAIISDLETGRETIKRFIVIR